MLIFYDQLSQIVCDYREQYGVLPTIKVITHSHGGNVVLNMAKMKNGDREDFVIDELILLACPVQAMTMEFIRDPMFKKIYTIYSSLDLVQVLAPQVVYKKYADKNGKMCAALNFPPLSDRLFPNHTNMAQVKIKMNGRALFHGEFVDAKFLSALADIIHAIDVWNIPTLTESTMHVVHLLCVHTTYKHR